MTSPDITPQDLAHWKAAGEAVNKIPSWRYDTHGYFVCVWCNTSTTTKEVRYEGADPTTGPVGHLEPEERRHNPGCGYVELVNTLSALPALIASYERVVGENEQLNFECGRQSDYIVRRVEEIDRLTTQLQALTDWRGRVETWTPVSLSACPLCTYREGQFIARCAWHQEQNQRVRALEEDRKVGDDLLGTFFEALKPLHLKAIDVANPGSHVTALIRELEALRVHVDAWYKAFGTTQLSHALSKMEANVAENDSLTTRVTEVEIALAMARAEQQRYIEDAEILERFLVQRTQERNAFKFAAEQAMGMGTGQAILDERDRLKMRVRDLEEFVKDTTLYRAEPIP